MPWSAESTSQCLLTLTGTREVSEEETPYRAALARRAERLVLALDRLVTGLNEAPTVKRLEIPLNRLFKDAQSLPDFDPELFATHLEEFQKTLAAK